MRWILSAVVLGGVMAGVTRMGGGAADVAAPKAPATQTRPAEDAIRWGAVDKGVRVGARLDRYYYAPTDDPEVTVLMERLEDKKAGAAMVAPGAPSDPSLVNVELIRNHQSPITLWSNADFNADPLLNNVVVVEKDKLWQVRFKLSALTSRDTIKPMPTGEYQLYVGVQPFQVGATAIPTMVGSQFVRSGEIHFEVTQRVPTGPMTVQPQREDLLVKPGVDYHLRMEFTAGEHNTLEPGIAVVDSPSRTDGFSALWEKVLTNKFPGSRALVGRLPGEGFSSTVEQFVREGHTFKIRLKRVYNPATLPAHKVTFLEAPLPRLLPGKYSVVLECVDTGQPAEMAPAKPLTCEFVVPDLAAGIEKPTGKEAFELKTYETLQALEKQLPTQVAVLRSTPTGPEYAWVPLLCVTLDKQTPGTGLAAEITGEDMKKVLQWLATEGFFQHEILTRRNHSTTSGMYELNLGGDQAINLSTYEAAWVMEGIDALLGAKSPAGLKELARKELARQVP